MKFNKMKPLDSTGLKNVKKEGVRDRGGWLEFRRVSSDLKYNQNGKPLNAEQQRQNFVLLGKVAVQLQSGQNQIVRNSNQFTETANEAPSANQIYNRVQQVLNGNQPIFYNNQEIGRASCRGRV
uniref:Hemocyanin C-terminal domain-containing protein n=1 Tax=Cacopsylla melanoneura TaxID=428564 RepID=A0A8D8S5A3_9HEMI